MKWWLTSGVNWYLYPRHKFDQHVCRNRPTIFSCEWNCFNLLRKHSFLWIIFEIINHILSWPCSIPPVCQWKVSRGEAWVFEAMYYRTWQRSSIKLRCGNTSVFSFIFFFKNLFQGVSEYNMHTTVWYLKVCIKWEQIKNVLHPAKSNKSLCYYGNWSSMKPYYRAAKYVYFQSFFRHPFFTWFRSCNFIF